MADIFVPQNPSNSYLYLPTNWNKGWLAAKQNSHTSVVSVLNIGGSISAGFSSSNFPTKGWFSLLIASLQGAYWKAGTYYPVSESVTPNGFTSGYLGTPPWSFVQAPTFYLWGLTHVTYYPTAQTNVMPLMSFVSPIPCNSIDIHYMDIGTGTWQYSLDGGGLNTLTCLNTNVMKKLSIPTQAVILPGQTLIPHTINIGKQSGVGSLLVMGATAWNGVTPVGIATAKLSYKDALAYEYGIASNQPIDRIAQFQGKSTSNTGYGFPTQPHLAIIELGIHDCAQLKGVEGFYQILDRMCRSIQYGRPGASILFVLPSNPESLTSDVTSGNLANAENWALYRNTVYNVAIANGCGVVDIGIKWGRTPSTQLLSTSSQPYPTDAGHQDIADTLFSILR